MQQSAIVSYAQGVIACLFEALRQVVQEQQRLIEKNLFRLGLNNTVFIRAFSGIPFVPVEADNRR